MAALLTAGLMVWASPAASADDVRVYKGLSGGSYTATCTGDTCVLTTKDPFGELAEFLSAPLVVTGGAVTARLPNTCGMKDVDFRSARTLTLTLTETDLTATIDSEAGEWRINGVHCWATGSDSVVRAKVSLPTKSPVAPTTPAAAAGGVALNGVATDRGDASSVTISRLASGKPDAPSVLSALRTSEDIEARSVLVAALLTVVLVLLIAFPTTLLNSAAEQGGDRFSAWWRRRRDPAQKPTPTQPGTPWWWAAGGVFVAGVISSFVDPQFGFNPGSVRALASILVGFGVEVVLGWLVVVWSVRRMVPGATASFAFRPLSLVLVAAAVGFTRLTGFEPGIIFGLVAGVGFAALLGRAAEARASLAPLVYGAVVAILAWGGYHLVDDATGTMAVFIAEALSAMAIAGLAALPIALFPVPGMPGETVFAWSKPVWVACYAFGLFSFFVVLLPTPYAWDEVGWTLKGWVLAYVAYLAVAVTIWAVVSRARPIGPTRSATPSVQGPDGRDAAVGTAPE
ncbi:MAG: hypothetical protein WAR57_11575 [Candidatus Phosphoribacter sp.]